MHEKIYLKLKSVPTDPRELLVLLYSFPASDTYLKSIATWKNKECTSYQCDTNRYRSFNDISHVLETYFPEITEKEILKLLMTTQVKNGNFLLLPYFCYCGDIRSIRFWFVNRYYDYFSYVNISGNFLSWNELSQRHFQKDFNIIYSELINEKVVVDLNEVCKKYF